MRVLVVNDDGPPSTACPYLRPFVTALHVAGHEVVVVIPDRPLSWIGKAHAVGKTLSATSHCPESSLLGGSGFCFVPGCGTAELRSHHWLVVDGPPASCTHLGLFHCGIAPEKFDVVVSGPNHGRNASTIYNLSSGTVGGALEAALCGRRAIALSFGSKDPQPEARIHRAAKRAVAVISSLTKSWHPGVELYSINIPMVDAVDSCPVHFTRPARTRWAWSLFTEIRRVGSDEKPTRSRQFRWNPDMSGIDARAKGSAEGEDLWALRSGAIGVTPLRANFDVVDIEGEF